MRDSRGVESSPARTTRDGLEPGRRGDGRVIQPNDQASGLGVEADWSREVEGMVRLFLSMSET